MSNTLGHSSRNRSLEKSCKKLSSGHSMKKQNVKGLYLAFQSPLAPPLLCQANFASQTQHSAGLLEKAVDGQHSLAGLGDTMSIHETQDALQTNTRCSQWATDLSMVSLKSVPSVPGPPGTPSAPPGRFCSLEAALGWDPDKDKGIWPYLTGLRISLSVKFSCGSRFACEQM